MIERINEQVAYNPVREHININFAIVSDKDQQLEVISQDLIDNDFDPILSRVLIFVRTRKAAEELVDLLIECLSIKGVDWADKVGFFHAGMDSADRESNYDDFQKGDKVILVATKAFGMGMDIPNIHYVYHVGPSSTFEDFLQEVGRAGRNKEKLHAAGFSSENPIKTKCVLTEGEFSYLRDLNHKSALGWNHIRDVQKTIFDYVGKFQAVVPKPDEAFPLPFDLLNSYSQFEDEFDKDGIFRLSLYWLERLGRIRLGLFTPAFLPIRLTNNEADYTKIQDLEVRKSIISFVEALSALKTKKFGDSDSVMVSMADLKTYSGQKNHFQLFKFLFLAQKVKALVVDRSINLEPTDLRTRELEEWGYYKIGLTIEAVFALAEKILSSTKAYDQISLSGDYLDKLILEVANEYFMPHKIFWKEFTKNKNERGSAEISKQLRNDFVAKRAKFAFKLIGLLPKMRHKFVIEVGTDKKRGEVVNLVYNGNPNNEAGFKLLKSYKNDLIKFIQYVSSSFFKAGEKSHNYIDLINHLNLQDQADDYMSTLIFLSKSLGYLKGEGSLVPMGIEMFIDDTSDINEKDRASQDFQVYQDFNEGIRLKELRLLSLECLSTLSAFKQDAFIKDYFKCSTSSELVGLLEEHFGESHPNLIAFRQEALSEAEEKLGEEQRLVYEAPIDTNLQVIAGPGSGKTHTLTLRVARLIQKEQISPDQILVLAYNRAVVVELKDRLSKLFKALGYSKLINRLKVFTFHGFSKYCLENELDGVEFDKWVPTFLDKLKISPGKINQKLGTIKYVFVDEFQDITNSRLELLKKIANPKKTKICVIGDPNQSIYGYDRVNEGGAMNPKPYYDQFSKIYKPEELYLTYNYRSLPDILTAAEELLSKNTSEFTIPKLTAKRGTMLNTRYCEVINRKVEIVDWRNKLQEMLQEEYEPNKKYHQIAIMYRSNEEVFRAYNELQNLSLEGVRLRIQGSFSSPFRSREFFHFLQIFKSKSVKKVSSTFIADFEAEKRFVIARYPNWDQYLINLIHCILIEFLVEKTDDSTYQDIIDFIEDLTGRDEGHFTKIFDKHISAVDGGCAIREIVLTTMHKVKGVEFDAVLMPPSFTNFPLVEEPDPIKLKELVEEERRLLYVAYTRARFRLVVLKYDRELAIDEGESKIFSDKIRNSLGIVVKGGLDKFFIGYGATESGNQAFDFIQHLKIGQSINLVKPRYNWFLEIGGRRVGCLNNEVSRLISFRSEGHDKVTGFSISSVDVWTYEETIIYDDKHKTSFADNWTTTARERGFIYIIEFSGFGKIQA